MKGYTLGFRFYNGKLHQWHLAFVGFNLLMGKEYFDIIVRAGELLEIAIDLCKNIQFLLLGS